MGELHLEVLVDRMKREFGIEIIQGTPQVAYKEAITDSVRYREIYKKQTGGRGRFADITFDIEPGDGKEEGLEFVNLVKGGNIPREYIPSIEKGFRESMMNGVLAGFPLVSLKVTLIDGSFHNVDSDAMAFEVAAKIGFKNACRKANSVLLEPIMKIEINTPDVYVGDVSGDLNKRRGHLENVSTSLNGQIIKGKVPLSEMFGYVTSLRTLSSGRANSNLEFSHYAEAPKNIIDEVLFKIKGYVTNY